MSHRVAWRHCMRKAIAWKMSGGCDTDVRFGSKADMCIALGNVCFVPIADILERSPVAVRISVVFVPHQLKANIRIGIRAAEMSGLSREWDYPSLPSWRMARPSKNEEHRTI